MSDAFADVAGVLTSVFHDLDLVPSDIAAGLFLMHLRTKRDREEIYRRRDQSPITSENVSPTSTPVRDNWNFGTGRAESSPSSALSTVFSGSANVPDDSYDWMNPSSASAFMKYAYGTYGWMWYLYGGFWKGLCNMKNGLVCCSCCR